MFVKYNSIYIQIFYLDFLNLQKSVFDFFQKKRGYMEPELHLSILYSTTTN
jgi:hypothetical protein